jgi:hypothetical protein
MNDESHAGFCKARQQRNAFDQDVESLVPDVLVTWATKSSPCKTFRPTVLEISLHSGTIQ